MKVQRVMAFGWIDGQIQSIDDDRYKKYFARRRPKSNWSEKNKELVQHKTRHTRLEKIIDRLNKNLKPM